MVRVRIMWVVRMVIMRVMGVVRVVVMEDMIPRVPQSATAAVVHTAVVQAAVVQAAVIQSTVVKGHVVRSARGLSGRVRRLVRVRLEAPGPTWVASVIDP